MHARRRSPARAASAKRSPPTKSVSQNVHTAVARSALRPDRDCTRRSGRRPPGGPVCSPPLQCVEDLALRVAHTPRHVTSGAARTCRARRRRRSTSSRRKGFASTNFRWWREARSGSTCSPHPVTRPITVPGWRVSTAAATSHPDMSGIDRSVSTRVETLRRTELQACGPARRLLHDVLGFHQEIAEHLAHRLLVVDDEDPRGRGPASSDAGAGGSAGSASGIGKRTVTRVPAPRPAVRRDRPAARVHDAPAHREPEAAALRPFRGEERLEDSGAHLRRHAASGVFSTSTTAERASSESRNVQRPPSGIASSALLGGW